jgi:hypothetical protein
MDEDLLLLINAAIPSVWALEALIVLQRDRGRTWTAEQLARELRSNGALATDVLRRLERAGLAVGGPDGFRFGPLSQALDLASNRLEEAWRKSPVAVVNAIVTSHNSPVQSFADAFRIRKKEPPR